MQSFLRISDAASLGLHTMGLLASRPNDMVSIQEVARALMASENHLAKVMQRLAKAGLARAVRGPKGGYALARKPEEITLLEVYEAIDGVVVSGHCLLGLAKCNWKKCVLGDLARSVNSQASDYLRKTSLDQLKDNFNWESQSNAHT